MSLLDNLIAKCTIRRRVRVKGTLGGSKDSFPEDQTDVSCWDQQASNSEVIAYQKQGMNISHKVYFLVDPAVRRRHQILITERNGVTISSPVILDVVSESLPDASAGKSILFKVMCVDYTARGD